MLLQPKITRHWKLKITYMYKLIYLSCIRVKILLSVYHKIKNLKFHRVKTTQVVDPIWKYNTVLF